MPTRLKKGSITLKQLVQLSKKEYAKKDIDNKKLRIKPDILGAKLIVRRNVDYNRSTKQWEQTGRDVRLDFLVRTNPTSYKRPEWDKTIHKYPVTFLFHNWDLKFDSPVKIRVGSNYKPKINKQKVSEQKTPQAKEKVREQNKKFAEYNLKKGVQLQDFFDSHFIYKMHNILFGPCYANRPPKERNPKNAIYLAKHSFFIATAVMPRIFNSPKINTLVKAK